MEELILNWWVIILLTLIIWGLSKSNQKVTLVVNPEATPKLKQGLLNLNLESLCIPNFFKHSLVQLGILHALWTLRKPLAATRREEVPLKHSPPEKVLLDWFIPENPSEASPIVVFIPGITGTVQNASELLAFTSQRHWTTVVYHRPGHESKLSTAYFNLFGNSIDLRSALEAIKASHPRSPLCLIGESAGSVVMTRYLGDYAGQSLVDAAIALSGGFKFGAMIDVCSGTVVDPYFVKTVKEFFVHPNRTILAYRNATALQKLEAARCFREFLEVASCFSKPEGYLCDYAEWERSTCPSYVLDEISVPTLWVNALDDPVCRKENMREFGYGLPLRNHHCALVVTENGSHCAHLSFHKGFPQHWGYSLALLFIEGVLGK